MIFRPDVSHGCFIAVVFSIGDVLDYQFGVWTSPELLLREYHLNDLAEFHFHHV